jgi:hypothetical protein
VIQLAALSGQQRRKAVDRRYNILIDTQFVGSPNLVAAIELNHLFNQHQL